MKAETRTITQDKVVFIAEDGKEFWSESECASYEQDLIEKRSGEILEKLPSFFLPWPDADVDTRAQWFYVRNQEELNAVKHHWYFFDADSSSHDYEAEAFPCWVRAMTYYEDDGCGRIESLESVIRSEENYLRNLKRLAAELAPKGDKG